MPPAGGETAETDDLEERILRFFREIEAGDIWFVASVALADDTIWYTASNGWQMTVMVEDLRWDFLGELVIAGRSLDYEKLYLECPRVLQYRPSPRVLRERYQWDELGLKV